jgi:hypothetical protein
MAGNRLLSLGSKKCEGFSAETDNWKLIEVLSTQLAASNEGLTVSLNFSTPGKVKATFKFPPNQLALIKVIVCSF